MALGDKNDKSHDASSIEQDSAIGASSFASCTATAKSANAESCGSNGVGDSYASRCDDSDLSLVKNGNNNYLDINTIHDLFGDDSDEDGNGGGSDAGVNGDGSGAVTPLVVNGMDILNDSDIAVGGNTEVVCVEEVVENNDKDITTPAIDSVICENVSGSTTSGGDSGDKHERNGGSGDGASTSVLSNKPSDLDSSIQKGSDASNSSSDSNIARRAGDAKVIAVGGGGRTGQLEE